MNEQEPQPEQPERHGEEHTSAQIQRIGANIVHQAEQFGISAASEEASEAEADSRINTETTLDRSDNRSDNIVIEKTRYGGEHPTKIRIVAGKSSTSEDVVGGQFLTEKREHQSPLSTKEIRTAAANVFRKQHTKLNAEKNKRDEFLKS